MFVGMPFYTLYAFFLCPLMFWSDAWFCWQDDICFCLDLNVAGTSSDWRVIPLHFRVDPVPMREYQSCLLSFKNALNMLSPSK